MTALAIFLSVATLFYLLMTGDWAVTLIGVIGLAMLATVAVLA
jgi:hypothetical protein